MGTTQQSNQALQNFRLYRSLGLRLYMKTANGKHMFKTIYSLSLRRIQAQKGMKRVQRICSSDSSAFDDMVFFRAWKRRILDAGYIFGWRLYKTWSHPPPGSCISFWRLHVCDERYLTDNQLINLVVGNSKATTWKSKKIGLLGSEGEGVKKKKTLFFCDPPPVREVQKVKKQSFRLSRSLEEERKGKKNISIESLVAIYYINPSFDPYLSIPLYA